MKIVVTGTRGIPNVMGGVESENCSHGRRRNGDKA